MAHLATCSGCPHCSLEMASLLGMSKTQYSKFLAGKTDAAIRAAQVRMAARRTSTQAPVRKTFNQWLAHFGVKPDTVVDVPDPPDLNAAVRAAHRGEPFAPQSAPSAFGDVQPPPDLNSAVRQRRLMEGRR